MWRVGDRLKARIKQVPRVVAELLETGGLKQKSIEVWPDFATTDGKKHGAALEAILIFGQGLPAVFDLDDAVKVYYTVDRTPEDGKQVIDVEITRPSAADGEARVNGDIHMTEKQRPGAAGVPAAENQKRKETRVSEELEKLRADEVVRLHKQVSDGESQIAKLKTSLEEMTTERDKERKEKEMLAKRVEMKDRAEIARFVDERVKARQLEPSQKDATVDHMLEMDEDKRSEYQKRLTALPACHTDASVPTTKPDPQEEVDADPDIRRANAIDKKAEELMKGDAKLSVADALARAKAEVA